MKIRYPSACECCKVHISTGTQVVMFAGHPWIPEHLVAYKAKRRALAASAK